MLQKFYPGDYVDSTYVIDFDKDYNNALELNPNYDLAYFGRGAARKSLNDKKGACEDFKKALELGYEEAEPYVKACR